MVFIDSDAFIGLRFKKDAHHLRALKILKALKDEEESLVTSWQVIDEVSTKLSYFSSKKMAMEFLNWVFKVDIRIIYVDKSWSKKIVKQFKNQSSKKVSLTDCTNMVICKDLGIKKIFSFDKHYKQNGFKLLMA